MRGASSRMLQSNAFEWIHISPAVSEESENRQNAIQGYRTYVRSSPAQGTCIMHEESRSKLGRACSEKMRELREGWRKSRAGT